MCRNASVVVNLKRLSSISASVSAVGPSSEGDDVIVGIAIDGNTCGINRMPPNQGYTGLASAACSKWLPPGSHVVDLFVYGSTAVAIKVQTHILGAVTFF